MSLTQTAIEIYHDQAVQLFSDVFRTMLRLEVFPVEADYVTPPGQVTAAVYFAGPWKGATFVDCSLNTAILFTQQLMPGCHPLRFDDDVQDCMGEIANMLGGNLKALLPVGVELSMPSVVQGSNYSVKMCGANSFIRIPFACEAGTFWVSIVEVKM